MKERLTDTKRCNEWITIKPDGCSCHQCERLEECDNNMKLYIMKHFVPRVALDRIEPKRLDKNKIKSIIMRSGSTSACSCQITKCFSLCKGDTREERDEKVNQLAEALVNKEADVWEGKD